MLTEANFYITHGVRGHSEVIVTLFDLLCQGLRVARPTNLWNCSALAPQLGLALKKKAKISIFKCVKILSRFSFLADITYENAWKLNTVRSGSSTGHTQTWWLSAVGPPPPLVPTVCSSGTSPSMQMLLFHREQTEWRSLQTADRNSWECIWGLTFQSVELCSYRPTFSSVQPFLRHNRGFTVAGSTVDALCSCL